MIRVLLPVLAAVVVAANACAAGGWREEAGSRIRRYRMGDVVVRVVDSTGRPVAGADVRIEQLSHDFLFGTALSHRMFSDAADPEAREKYQRIATRFFNAAVHENALKWYFTEPEKGAANYGPADRVLEWCEAHGIRMRGHAVFWGVDRYVMPWLKELDDAELRREVERRAAEVAARYASRIDEWDVNNEMLHGRYYRGRLGESIIKDMFDSVKLANENAVLYVNDYNVLIGSSLNDYAGQIAGLIEEGVPLGGIGLQAHFDMVRMVPGYGELMERLDGLAEFGLPIKITEFDFNTKNEKLKARKLDEFYRTCFSHPAVEGIYMWGFWEGAHWIPDAALFDMDFRPRPAAAAYRGLVLGEWWSDESGATGKTGEFSTRVFFGRYAISAAAPSGVEVTKEFYFPKGIELPKVIELERD